MDSSNEFEQDRPTAGEAFFNSVRRTGWCRPNDRWIGGVCAAISARYGWDLPLVRGVCVVLTLFFAPAICTLYAAAWALLPEEVDGRIHAQELLRGNADVALLGIVALLILPPLNISFTGSDSFAPVFQFRLLGFALVPIGAIIVFILVMEHRSKKRRGSTPNYGRDFTRAHAQPYAGSQHGDRFAPNQTGFNGPDSAFSPEGQQASNVPAGDADAARTNADGDYIAGFHAATDSAAGHNTVANAHADTNGYTAANRYADAPYYPPVRARKGPGLATFLAITGALLVVLAAQFYFSVDGYDITSPFNLPILAGSGFILAGSTLGYRALKGLPGTWLTALTVFCAVLVPVPLLIALTGA